MFVGAARQVAVVLAVAAICSGCQRRPTLDELPRQDITLEQRDRWRAALMWPGDCEDAFRASAAGSDGGVRVVRLSSTASVVEVTCAAGSYQPSALRFKLTEGSAGLQVTPLAFPVYASEDGRHLQLSRQTELWGESVISPASSEIAILSLARQTADCGVWTRYSLAGDRPELLAAAARVECPATPGPPATISGSSPPSGWNPISRKD